MGHFRDRRAFGNVNGRRFRGARYGDGKSPRFTGLLDLYGGASAAYSLRALSRGWLAGDVVEVRPSSGAAAMAFTSSQITNGELLDFIAPPDARALYNNAMYWESVTDDRVDIPFSNQFFSGGNTITVNATLFSEGGGVRYYEAGAAGAGTQFRLLKGGFAGGFAPLEFRHRFSTSGETIWTTVETPIQVGVEHEISVTYDSSSNSNDPVITVDGVPMTTTESNAPVGTVPDADTDLILGNSEALNGALNGAIRNVTVGSSTYVGDGNTNANWLDTSANSNDGIVGGSPAVFTGQGLDGFVSTWYDQSGNANDATQATTTAQPKIVDAGALVANGIDFYSNSLLSSAAFADGTSSSVFMAFNNQSADASRKIFFSKNSYPANGVIFNYRGDSSVGRYDFVSYDGTTRSLTYSEATSPLLGLSTTIINGSGKEAFLNGTSRASDAETFVGGNTVLRLGGIGNGFEIAEVIIYPTDESANRVAIETNINDHYSIYA